jgi:hypothetical protein
MMNHLQHPRHHHHHHHPQRQSSPRRLTRRRTTTTGKENNVILAMFFAVMLIPSIFLLLQQQQQQLGPIQESSLISTLAFPSSSSSSTSENETFVMRAFSNQKQQQQQEYVYTSSHAEQYLLDNPAAFGFNTTGNTTSSACRLWRTVQENNALLQELQEYKLALKEYAAAVEAFEPIDDLRLHLRNADSSNVDNNNYNESHHFCKLVNLYENGIQGFFQSSSKTTHRDSRLLSHSNTAGYMEPLLPPMRHPSLCLPNSNGLNLAYLMDLTYLVHDFGALCRQLQRHSRIVLFDMGASINFHGHANVQQEPIMHLIHLFAKFGFPFDHIYAYEKNKTDPDIVFGERLPIELMPAYHWINVAIVSEPGHRLNPFTTLLQKYTEDDIVIVKLDIDTPDIEVALAEQILDSGDPRLAKIIDHFYLEHHVYMEELSSNWGGTMQGSIQDSLHLFHRLRQAGVAAHFWV